MQNWPNLQWRRMPRLRKFNLKFLDFQKFLSLSEAISLYSEEQFDFSIDRTLEFWVNLGYLT